MIRVDRLARALGAVFAAAPQLQVPNMATQSIRDSSAVQKESTFVVVRAIDRHHHDRSIAILGLRNGEVADDPSVLSQQGHQLTPTPPHRAGPLGSILRRVRTCTLPTSLSTSALQVCAQVLYEVLIIVDMRSGAHAPHLRDEHDTRSPDSIDIARCEPYCVVTATVRQDNKLYIQQQQQRSMYESVCHLAVGMWVHMPRNDDTTTEPRRMARP